MTTPAAFPFNLATVILDVATPTSGYLTGDVVALQAPGIAFSTAPSVTVTASGGVVTAIALANPGQITGPIPDAAFICTQSSTTGVGKGLRVFATVGADATNVQVFTASGTYLPTPGMVKCDVYLVISL